MDVAGRRKFLAIAADEVAGRSGRRRRRRATPAPHLQQRGAGEHERVDHVDAADDEKHLVVGLAQLVNDS